MLRWKIPNPSIAADLEFRVQATFTLLCIHMKTAKSVWFCLALTLLWHESLAVWIGTVFLNKAERKKYGVVWFSNLSGFVDIQRLLALLCFGWKTESKPFVLLHHTARKGGPKIINFSGRAYQNITLVQRSSWPYLISEHIVTYNSNAEFLYLCLVQSMHLNHYFENFTWKNFIVCFITKCKRFH